MFHLVSSGVTVTSPVSGSPRSNATVGISLDGVVTFTGCDGFFLGSVTVPVPQEISFLGSLSFGTSTLNHCRQS